jgi:hypothetical protein
VAVVGPAEGSLGLFDDRKLADTGSGDVAINNEIYTKPAQCQEYLLCADFKIFLKKSQWRASAKQPTKKKGQDQVDSNSLCGGWRSRPLKISFGSS